MSQAQDIYVGDAHLIGTEPQFENGKKRVELQGEGADALRKMVLER